MSTERSFRVRLVSCWVLGILLAAAGATGSLWGATLEEDLRHEHVAGEVLVKFRSGAPLPAVSSLREELGAETLRRFGAGGERWLLGPGRTTAEAIEALRRSALVEYAEPNYVVSLTATPNDPRYPELWGLHNTGQNGGTPGADIDAEAAWNISTGSSNVVVAVIDTGVDYNHPDLAARMWTNPGEIAGNGVDDDGNGFIDDVRGWDFYNDDNDPMDDHSHGTHTSGTIGAIGNNALGVAGVAWNVTILPVKFLGAGGSGTTEGAILSVEYATAAGVDVMSNSWGGGGFSQALLDAISAASDAGILFVAAAGNYSSDNDAYPTYPASYEAPNVVAVAATDRWDGLAYFSNYGAQSVDLGAPGVETLSCVPGAGYATKSGTSMATPHVSGVAALIRSIAPDIDVTNLVSRLLQAVDPVPSLAGRTRSGGRLNAFLAIADPDAIPPDAVTDLSIAEATSNSLFVEWTATGDDGDVGRASAYEVRWSDSPIDDASFPSATPAPGAPFPAASGAVERMEIGGLQPDLAYYVALRVKDEWGNAGGLSNVAVGQTLPAPTFSSDPASFEVALLTGAQATRILTLENAGVGTLDWTIADPLPGPPGSPAEEPTFLDKDEPDPRTGPPVLGGAGGPDEFGYRFLDSDQPGGPVFEWNDLQSVGTPIAELTGDDQTSEPIPLGFVFDFYGTPFDAVRVSTNGFLSFTNTGAPYTNQPLPSSGAPEFLVAPFWDDLDFGGIARAVWTGDGTTFTVQYTNVARYGSGGSYTFQVSLHSSGVIEFRYHSMVGIVDGATVGIQDGMKSVDLQVAFNAAYVRDDLALSITAVPGWLEVAPRSGRLHAAEQAPVTLSFDATGLDGGVYESAVVVETNDPERPVVSHPVTLTVTGVADIRLLGAEVVLTSGASYTASGAATNHTFAIEVPPVNDGRLELVADGDYGDTGETATASAEGQVLGRVGQVGADCTPASDAFPIAADDLASLAADGLVEVRVANSSAVDAFCGRNRHDVTLRYRQPADVLDYGQVYAAGRRERSIEIENLGTDTLHVTSIASDVAVFVPSAPSLVIPPRSSETLGVVFTPDSIGEFTGVLTIVSDDPDEAVVTVALRGEGVAAPDVEITPAEFTESLPVGASVSRILTIANTGGHELIWTAAVGASRAPAGIAEPQTVLPSESTTAPPEGFAPRAAEPETSVDARVLIVQDVAPWSTTSNQVVLQANGIPYDIVNTSALGTVDLSPYRVVIVASDQTTSSYLRIDDSMGRLADFVAGGGVLEFHAAGWGWSGGDASVVTLPGDVSIERYISSTNTVVDPLHPTMEGVPGTLTGSGASHASFRNLPGVATVITVDDRSEPTLAEYRWGGGLVIACGQTLEYYYQSGGSVGLVLANLIPYAYEPSPRWLSVAPASGSIPPGGVVEATVTVDATFLLGGDYEGRIDVSSNDPDESVVDVPVHLHATGEPDIVVLGSEVVLASELPFSGSGAQTSHSLPIDVPPAGDGVLELFADGDYGDSAETATAYAEGRAVGTVGNVGWDCAAANGGFPIASDDLDALAADGVVNVVVRNSSNVGAFCERNRHRVVLRYHASVSDLDFGSMFVGLTRTLTLQVENRGTDFLDVTEIAASGPEFLTSESSFRLPPRSARSLDVTFAPSAAGSFEATLAITSNDPDTPVVSIPLAGVGLDPPVIGVAPASLSSVLDEGAEQTQPLTISNSGGSTLEFSVTVASATVAGSISEFAGLAIGPTPPGNDPAVEVAPMDEGPPPPATDGENWLATPGEFQSLRSSPVPLTCVVADPSAGAVYAQANQGWTLYRYSPGADSWDSLASSPLYSGNNGGAALLNGKIYTAYAESAHLGVYDIATNTWTTRPSPLGTGTATIASDGTQLLYLAYSSQVVSLDPATGVVTTLPPPPIAFDRWGGLQFLEGKLYGHRGNGATDFASYDIDLGAWTRLPSLPSGAVLGSAVDPYGEHYFAVGSYGARNLYRYSMRDGTWSVATIPTFPVDDGGLGWLAAPVPGVLIVQGQAGVGLARFVTQLPPVSVAPKSGTIEPGTSAALDVRFDGRAAPPGTHELELRVSSNDPSHPLIEVPATLTVIGRPDIALVGGLVISESIVPFSSYSATTSHVIQLTETPTSGSTLELVANGDFGNSGETATMTAEGFVIGSVGVVGSDCVPAGGTFDVDPARTNQLAADGVVRVDVQNSSSVDLFCSENSHRVRFSWRRPADRIDFGRVFLGTSYERTIEIRNDGSATLHVTSIASDSASFVPSASGLDIAPRSSSLLRVVFAPEDAATFDGVLTILSDDPDEGVLTVALHGEAVVPPDIGISPPALDDVVFQGNVEERTITISNTGGSDLSWELSLRRTGGAPSESSPPDEAPPAASTTTAPEGFQAVPTEPVISAGARVLIVQDVAPWGSAANQRILQLNGVPYDIVNTTALGTIDLSPYDVILVAADQTTPAYGRIASNMGRVADFVAGGGVLEFHAAGWGWNSGDASRVTLPGGMRIQQYYSSINFVSDPSHPAMAGVPASFTGNSASPGAFRQLPAHAWIVTTDNRGDPTFVEYRWGTGLVVASSQPLEFYADRGGPIATIHGNLVAYAWDSRPAWIAVSPTEGAVPAGGSSPITVTIDATVIQPGDYSARILVESNDPDEPDLEVPVTIHVIGVPNIDVSPVSLEFGTVFVGFPRTLSIVISNTGLEPLHVTSISSTDPAVSVNASSLTLAPAESRVVSVTMNPLEARALDTTLVVESDDPDEGTVSVNLTGTALIPPDVEIDPLSLEATELSGDAATRVLTIRNTGGSDLSWQLDTIPAAVDPDPAASGIGALLIQDVLPWNADSNERVLELNGIPWAEISSTQVATTNLNQYRLVIIAADQTTTFYTRLSACAEQLAAYVDRGGILEVHAAGFGSHGGDASQLRLPGGVQVFESNSNTNTVVDPSHPIVAGVPGTIVSTSLATAAFTGVPDSAEIIARNHWEEDNLIVYPFGLGIVVASGQNLERGYHLGHPYGRILSNMIPWAYASGKRWLSVSPAVGTVAAGTSVDLEVVFDGNGLEPGEYMETITVRSNDPDEPSVQGSALFHVLRLRADAGPDQLLECSGGGGSIATLVGSGSAHMDGPGNITDWLWSEGGVPLGTGESLDVHLLLGGHDVSLRVEDSTGASNDDGTRVTVVDTTPPSGTITYPSRGACLGPSAVPVVIGDDFADACDGSVDRRYEPPGGETWSTHGDHSVTLVATDGRGHAAAPETVSFTLDLVEPVVTTLVDPGSIEFTNLMPVSRYFGAHDEDGSSGNVVREVVVVDGCVAYDGFAYGDLDGLLLDEDVPEGEETICRLAQVCGRRRWVDPALIFRATDCGNNDGASSVTLTGEYVASECRFELGIRISPEPEGTRISWDPVLNATGYDVVRGSLDRLRLSDGAYRYSTVECLASLVTATSVLDPEPPPAGDGYWYLVRDVTDGQKGSWDEPAPSQIGSREPIDSASGRCP